MSEARFPRDMAKLVRSELTSRDRPAPDLPLLVNLFETLYFASLRTEELQPITFHIVYADPASIRPSSALAGWSYVPLADLIPATVSNLVKIAEAADPRASSFAVHHDDQGHLLISGLIDQGNSQYGYVTYESDDTRPYPGLFQASIINTGHIVATVGFEKIAELKAGVLLGQPLDVLSEGPVLARLQPGIDAYIHRTREALLSDNPALDYKLMAVRSVEWQNDWDRMLTNNWISALVRLLLRVQNYKHGGAILLTPDASQRWLNIKYKAHYPRLRSSLDTLAYAQAVKLDTWNQIGQAYMGQQSDDIPASLYVDRMIAGTEVEQSQRALDGALWFTSLLTRVDGLVLMNPQLEVLGFGTEIICPHEPDALFLSEDARATEQKLRPTNLDHHGTRHRSMMRYCAQEPGSVGFVISEDGEVRVCTSVNGRLVMWENIKLHREPGSAHHAQIGR